MIESPYVSQNLTRTYKKTIEVYELKDCFKPPIRGRKQYNAVKKFTYKKFTYKKKWIETPANAIVKGVADIRDEVNYMPGGDKDLFFTSFELAYISKIMMIQSMKVKYYAEIKKIQETMERNVPDLTEHLKKIKAEHPEFLI